MKRKITIVIDDGEDEREIGDFGDTSPVVNPGAYQWERSPRYGVEDNGWVGGIDICANCPNRPGGPNNKSGICNCAIPSMYGPNRVTC